MSWGAPTELRIDSELPFMAEKEYFYIQALIKEMNYKTALEWGAGSSTLWFPRQSDIKWTAIEHNPVYVDYLKPKISNNVDLRLVEDGYEYVNVDGKYDFILIDGLYRDECLEKAFKILNPGGRIILHDSGRAAYKKWYSKYPHRIVFEGEGWLGDGWDHRGLAEFK